MIDALTEELENRWYELGRLARAETKRRYPPSVPSEYIKKAAVQGNADAQYEMGYAYLQGYGIGRSGSEAYRWYRKAAMQGHAKAQYICGEQFMTSVGVGGAEAIKWLRKSAEQGYGLAQLQLGRMYEPHDEAEAIRWYNMAAAQDFHSDHEAWYRLGCLHERRQDFMEAAGWYEKAAASFREDAMYRLFLLYESGKGVARDEVKAAEFLEKAADWGQRDAQYALGCRHQSGQSAVLDGVEAYKWFALAALMYVIVMDAEKYEEAVSRREQVATQLTPEQINAAHQRIRKWQEKRTLLEGQSPPPALALVQ